MKHLVQYLLSSTLPSSKNRSCFSQVLEKNRHTELIIILYFLTKNAKLLSHSFTHTYENFNLQVIVLISKKYFMQLFKFSKDEQSALRIKNVHCKIIESCKWRKSEFVHQKYIYIYMKEKQGNSVSSVIQLWSRYVGKQIIKIHNPLHY